jgi:PAS domain-containing protein
MQRAILESVHQAILVIAPDYAILLFNRYAAEAAWRVLGQEL